MNGQPTDQPAPSDYATIVKARTRLPAPSLDDYARVCASFSWVTAQAMLSGLPRGGLNIAHQAVDRHAASGRGGVPLVLRLRPRSHCDPHDDEARPRSTRRLSLAAPAFHLIGPFEVESALLEHPAVAEAAVIGTPDAMAGEVVKAFVALKAGFEAREDLRK